MFTFWFQKAGKVRCSLKFNYRPRSMIKTHDFRKYVACGFFFLSFLKKNQQCDFAALLSSSLFFPLGFIFLSSSLFLILFCLSYFLKGSGWLPLIIISWMLWLWAKMLIVKHEAKMNGFSPISLHTLPPVAAYGREDEDVYRPDFANILWSLEERGYKRKNDCTRWSWRVFRVLS